MLVQQVIAPEQAGAGEEPAATNASAPASAGTNADEQPAGAEGDGSSQKPLFRLFVGWVPKLFTERDLMPLFQKVRCAAAHTA